MVYFKLNKERLINKAVDLIYFIILMSCMFLVGTGLSFLDEVSR